MRRLLQLTWNFGLVMLAPTAAALAQAGAATSPPPSINTSGTGESQATPDRATILLAVETRDATAAATGQANARNQRQVIDALKKLGIAQEEISTFGYTVYPDQRYDGKQTKVIGYIARNTVRVELRRIDQVGPAIDAGLANGANVVSSLRFYSSHYDEVRRTALAAAVAQARADADVMARAAGGTIGGLSELSSSTEGPRPFQEGIMARAVAISASAPTPIEPGEQTVRVTVSARWTFVPAR